MKILIEKIKIRLRRWYILHLSHTPRKGSYPFVSGDTFREWADMIYEKGLTFTPNKVKEGDIIFLSGEVFEEFFTTIHPFIKVHYKLITHNSDHVVGEKEVGYIDDKIIQWFAQNALVSHPKITPIPIALESLSYSNAGRLTLFKNREKPVTKKNRILVNFSTRTNPKERGACLEAMHKNKLAYIVTERMTQKEYVSLLKHSRTVASPPGNGPDCHRTWEAVLFGTIPIVKRGFFIEHFASLGLPVWIVDDYSEIAELSEKDLVEKCNKITASSKNPADTLLSFNYWHDIIKSTDSKHA